MAKKRWSDDEDRVIHAFYPDSGVSACLDRLPHRSAASIYHRAHALGVTRDTSLESRFWAKVDISNGISECWIWNGAARKDGRGILAINGKPEAAARVAWRLRNGAIPPGMCVCHKCDIPSCVNPHHLFVGTHADNVADKMAKDREARGFALPHTRLSDAQVAEIRSSSLPAKALAEKYQVSARYVYEIITQRKRMKCHA